MLKKILCVLLFLAVPAFASETLQLNQGWNLKGAYLDNVDISQFDNDNISTVWKWANNKWEIYSPYQNIKDLIAQYKLETITEINAGDGFWVNSKANTSIDISGDTPSDTTLSIVSGWQLISLKSGESSISTTQLNNDNISTVWKWSAGQWEIYGPSSTVKQLITQYKLTEITSIEPGEGFWVNSKGNASITPPSLSFVAVDPYIEGAVFFEDKNGNGIPDDGEQFSNPSDENGVFTFDTPPSPNSIITMIEQGTEDGEAYDGIIKTTLDMCDDTTAQCVASPLTTLVANGLTKQQVIDILSKVGINITMDDFKKNPLKNLKNKVVSMLIDDDFSKLQASMMLNGFMNVLKKMGKNGFAVTYEDFDNDTINNYLLPMANLVKGVLNKGILEQMKSQMESQIPPGASLPPVTGEVIIKAAASVMHFVTKKAVEQIANGENVDFQAIQSLIADKAESLAKKYYAVMNADKFSPTMLSGIKQMAGLNKLKKGMFFNINDNGSISGMEKGKFLPFNPDYISNVALILIGQYKNIILKFYDNNTVMLHKLIKSTKTVENFKGTWEINDNGTLITTYLDKEGKKFGAYIYLIANGIDVMRVKLIRYYDSAFLDMYNTTFKKVKKCKECAKIFEKFGGISYPVGKQAFFIYNPVDNITGKGTGKYFEFSPSENKFFTKGVFMWYLNHFGAVVKEYPNGDIVKSYILWKNAKFVSGVVRKITSDGTNYIYPFLSKRSIFQKTFKDIDLSGKIIGSFGKDGFQGIAFFDNKGNVSYVNDEDDNISIDNLTWSVDNVTGWMIESDGTKTRLLSYDPLNQVLFVDNHYPGVNYINSNSLEKWIVAKPFPDNMTGTYTAVDDNTTETLKFYDNGTGSYSGDGAFNFNYLLSSDNMTLTLTFGTTKVEFNLLKKDSNKFMLMGAESDNGTYQDLFSDIWTKQ